ncbi:MAG: hypothetical protein Hyperionvirus4_103 [Hyperionvirus sp.]|uniref:Uncharacterized protein n=1 Tax=Hyperionvirus sp. TaxID=2487770 RepID=A0A3G5A7I7_9VIRU|nr:MAG: hypothetical protein Hyperionvirus4_103 [Hyperionvirus sp.]
MPNPCDNDNENNYINYSEIMDKRSKFLIPSSRYCRRSRNPIFTSIDHPIPPFFNELQPLEFDEYRTPDLPLAFDEDQTLNLSTPLFQNYETSNPPPTFNFIDPLHIEFKPFMMKSRAFLTPYNNILWTNQSEELLTVVIYFFIEDPGVPLTSDYVFFRIAKSAETIETVTFTLNPMDSIMTRGGNKIGTFNLVFNKTIGLATLNMTLKGQYID